MKNAVKKFVYATATRQLFTLSTSSFASILWASVIKAIHGVDGNIGKCSTTSNKSCWENILNEVKVLSNKDIDFLKYTRIRLGDGESTVFWDDYWNEGGKLKDLFPRLYNLETSKGITIGRKLAQPNLIYSFRRTPRGGAERVQMEELEQLINSVRLTPMADILIWTLDSAGIFSMASVRTLIDNKMLRVGVETSRHLFFECGMVKQVSHLINRWWDVPDMEIDSYDTWKTWLSIICMHSTNKKMFEGVYYVMWWLIWNFRNKKIFEAKVILKAIFLMMFYVNLFIGVGLDVKPRLVGTIG
uniref:RNA-directed DNA polymerase, eukaryota, reverse transcriptase zinc-binding domain protein n=1 Tax=Tanacetum cinerariifolium TaxID=118510 RepID=A0A699HQR1_TANCI|nr:RNA-directed DNA polymerase, eukaryota, reverse transcriptase zinc-binding domain protein [Tanacetum cinerariifolium]